MARTEHRKMPFNFCAAPKGPVKAVFCLILHEPDDPDPNRRFKMIREEHPRAIMAAFSPDGLRWTDSPNNPILRGSGLETGGLIRFDGFYYLNGQGGAVPHPVPGVPGSGR